MRNHAPSSHPAVCNGTLPLDVGVRNRAPSCFIDRKASLHPMMVFIGTILEGWGLFVVFSILANKSCCTKPTEKHTQAPSKGPNAEG